jgi:hypothetical protein
MSFHDQNGTGYTPGLALWCRAKSRPGMWAIVPLDGGAVFFACVDDFGNLHRVAS